MSRALVVYESFFGNTAAIARAIADGLAYRLEVELVEVDAAPATVDADLLVVGGPTHAFGMSKSGTRAGAVDQGRKLGRPVRRYAVGIREWLETVTLPDGIAVTTFDTKFHASPGSAAGAALRLLRRHGAHIAAHPARFYVTRTPGPLVDGELERARAWGRQLSERIAAATYHAS
jgi:flavodoxin